MNHHDHDPRTIRERALEAHGVEAFGTTLVIEVSSEDPIGDLRDVADRAERGEDVPATIAVPPEDLRRLITPARLAVIEAIMDDPPASIQALADRLDRSYPAVHDDVELLADLGVVVFRREGRANRPVVPYDRIEYRGVIAREAAID